MVLGDGIRNFGANNLKRNNLFSKVGGVVTVVADRKADYTALLKITGNMPENILEETSFLAVMAFKSLFQT